MSNKSQVKITLIRELDNGGTESEQVTIKKLKFRQFNRTLSLVTQILEAVDENPELRGIFFDMFFGATFDRSAFPEKSEEELNAMALAFEEEKGTRLMLGVVSSFRIILNRLPDLALELLAVMARVDHELLLDQEIEVGFDVLDAVLEVNDMEELIERGKQSLSLARQTFSFMNKKEQSQSTAAVPVNVLRQ